MGPVIDTGVEGRWTTSACATSSRAFNGARDRHGSRALLRMHSSTTLTEPSMGPVIDTGVEVRCSTRLSHTLRASMGPVIDTGVEAAIGAVQLFVSNLLQWGP